MFSYKAKEKSTEKLSSSLLASISQYCGRGRLTAKLLYICFGACVYKYVCESYYYTLHLLPQLLNFRCLSDIFLIQIIISITGLKIQERINRSIYYPRFTCLDIVSKSFGICHKENIFV